MRWVLVAFLLIGSVAAPPGTVHAQVLEPFRAVVSGRDVFCVIANPLIAQHLVWLGVDRTYYDSDVRQIDSADGQHVLALTRGDIVRITPDNSRTPFFSDPILNAAAFAVAPNGRVFAKVYPIPFPTPTNMLLGVISPHGVLEATHAIPGMADHPNHGIWDGGDDCTVLFLRTNGATGRFNACSGEVLADLPLPLHVRDVEPLPTGQLLVVTRNRVQVHNATGNLVRVIVDSHNPDTELGQAAITPDGQSIVYAISSCTTTNGWLVTVPFFADAVEFTYEGEDIDINMPTGLVLGATHPAPVPAMSEIALLLLTFTLAFAAVFLLRR